MFSFLLIIPDFVFFTKTAILCFGLTPAKFRECPIMVRTQIEFSCEYIFVFNL